MSRSWLPAENAARVGMGSGRYDRLQMDSKLQAARPVPAVRGEPLTVPIYHTSVYRNTSVQQYLDIIEQSGYIYQRLGNPTVEAAELPINQLENGAGTLLYSSGLAAINATFLCFLKAGDHLICQSPCYSGTYKFVIDTVQKFGVNISWSKAGAPMKEWADLVRPETTMIYAETPCNPSMQLVDLKALADIGKQHNIKTVVDGTFASPIIQTPLDYGIDVSIHSCSKYIGGHSDLIGGCVTTRTLQDWQSLKNQMGTSGLAMAPFEASLVHRGLKTLALRVERQSRSALQIARFLESAVQRTEYPVKAVHYPGLDSHAQHELARRQMGRGLFGGMLAFEMETLEQAKCLVEAVKLIHLSVSLGGTESLIEHPATMTHGPMLMSAAESNTTPPGLIRLSVGLEDPSDLIYDLERALEAVNKQAE